VFVPRTPFQPLAKGGELKYCIIYHEILTLATAVNYKSIFITLAHAALVVHVNLTLREILEKKCCTHRLLEKIVKKLLWKGYTHSYLNINLTMIGEFFQLSKRDVIRINQLPVSATMCSMGPVYVLQFLFSEKSQKMLITKQPLMLE
jgi:hypothetical protein